MGVTFKESTEKTAAKPAPKSKKKLPDGGVTFIQRVIKADTYMVMSSAASEPEDEFVSLYYSVGSPTNSFIEPPFPPKTLKTFCFQNNIMAQCVEAMEVNVDGTGYEFTGLTDKDEPDPSEAKRLDSFFAQPYPGKSFITIRRELRRELEQTGWAFLEGICNAAGELVGIRNIVGHSLRLSKLGAPVLVKKTIQRDGKDVELEYWTRERAFGQTMFSNKVVYYREWGTSRQLHRDTGEWETPEAPVPPDKRATELLLFKIHDDVTTSYGLPRWINQLPSVIGSRKAEEDNLQLMDAGGLPPAIIFVQGGTIAKEASDQLKMYLSGQLKNKNRAVVVDAQPTSGSLDSTGKVDVKVERFGSTDNKDAMYEKYDVRTEEHVRKGFRLPPLFIGQATDYSYASAATSYMVAEAQVFHPERVKFDEFMNLHVVARLGCKKTKFKSKPITLKDVASVLAGLELAKDKTDGTEWVGEVNKAVGTKLTYSEEADAAAQAAKQPSLAPGQVPPGKNGKPPNKDDKAKGKNRPAASKMKPPSKPQVKKDDELLEDSPPEQP